MSKILLLEDDLSLIQELTFAFKKENYDLDIARTICEVDQLWADGKYDLLILDVSLPDGSGFEICKKVRQTSKVPIIFLTASDEEISIIMGLDMGGDDYITKPFKLGVLMSRINALLRRVKNFGGEETELCSNGIKVLLLKGQVYQKGNLLDLTAGEYKLLCLFISYVILVQAFIWSNCREIVIWLLLCSVFLVIMFIAVCFGYFYRQNKTMEAAVSQINAYLAGDINARIPCDRALN